MGGLSEPPARPGGQGQDEGVTTLDLMNLPPVLLRIMRLIMRHKGEMTHLQIGEANTALPEDTRLSQADLDDALKQLIEQHWLVVVNQDQSPCYKLNLHRKASASHGHDSSHGGTSSKLSQGIWDALDVKPVKPPHEIDGDKP